MANCSVLSGPAGPGGVQENRISTFVLLRLLLLLYWQGVNNKLMENTKERVQKGTRE